MKTLITLNPSAQYDGADFELRNLDTDEQIDINRNPLRLSNAAFDAGATSVTWTGEACLEAFKLGY